ncbi:MAG: DUF5591 domain-containing protein [Thermoplasmatales archaeon]|nr:DUF5591 domain-containing protein [Thermoplasmatales archaeon]
MQFNVKQRDGPSRIGELLIDNKQVVTPNILYVNTDRFKAPNFADIITTNTKGRKDKPSLQIPKQSIHLTEDTLKDKSGSVFIVVNAYQLFQQPRNFVNFIVELREKIGYQKMIYPPSIGDPTNLALLSYMGIDLFDSTSAIIAARKDILLFPNVKHNKNDIQELPCDCPSCSKFTGKPSDMKFQDILNHNYYEILKEIKHIRNAINQGNLRGLVETRVKADPNLTAILRNLDTNHNTFLEKRTPITSNAKVYANSKESLLRPDIRRFQKRVIVNYKKPKSAKILLLLPCSAKKPYSFSKSHKFFRDKLISSGNPFVVHEVIVTSPMGLVPRELELVYPASSYDIPVTGVWDEDEKKMIRTLLTTYLKANKYDKIISHLPKGIMDFVEDLLKNPEKTCIDRPTSDKSVEKLAKVLKRTVNDYDQVKPQTRLVNDMQGFASYQFGKKTAEQLLKDCSIRGRYPYQKIMHNNTQLGMVTKERGLISLTINGAKIIVKSKKYWVKIYDDFTLKGSVFAPGVKDADEGIRIGDEVVVIKNSKLCAVGVAQMNGDEMKESSHGEAVKVRHKI